MSYTALYRKFRPAVFGEVKGQDHIVTTLKNQLAADRIGHAYLFTGTRGTGKTTMAKIFAKAVNCEHPVDGSPCGECETCRAIASGASLNVIEIDAASNNGVDSAREIVEEVAYSPTQGRYKVYIIDEVHMLSTGAFNALLKTLEEPPSYVIFILATTEVHKIPITILSRCQRYDFHRITIDTITARLADLMKRENISVEEKALRYIARVADGSMRDALSLMDQCIAFHYGETLTYDMALEDLGAVDTRVFSNLLRCVVGQDVLGCMKQLEDVIEQGRELSQFVTEFTWYLRNVLLIGTSDELEEVIDVSSENLKALKEEAGMLPAESIMRYIRIFSELSGQIKYSAQKRILIEIALIKLCRPQMEATPDSVADRLRGMELEQGEIARDLHSLESQLKQGNFSVAGPASQVAPQERAPLPKAIPEDIEQVLKNWRNITSSAIAPLSMYLREAKVSMVGDNQLALVTAESHYFLTLESHQAEIQALISDYIGKEVAVVIKMANGQSDLVKTYPDLMEMIRLDVEIDDSDDTDDF